MKWARPTGLELGMEAADLLACGRPKLTLAHQIPFKRQESSAGLNSTLKKRPVGVYFGRTIATEPLARTFSSYTVRWQQNGI